MSNINPYESPKDVAPHNVDGATVFANRGIVLLLMILWTIGLALALPIVPRAPLLRVAIALLSLGVIAISYRTLHGVGYRLAGAITAGVLGLLMLLLFAS